MTILQDLLLTSPKIYQFKLNGNSIFSYRKNIEMLATKNFHKSWQSYYYGIHKNSYQFNHGHWLNYGNIILIEFDIWMKNQ